MSRLSIISIEKTKEKQPIIDEVVDVFAENYRNRKIMLK